MTSDLGSGGVACNDLRAYVMNTELGSGGVACNAFNLILFGFLLLLTVSTVYLCDC